MFSPPPSPVSFSDDLLLPGSSPKNFSIATILIWLWTARNLATFRNLTLGFQQIVDFITHNVKSRVRCAAVDVVKNFSSFNSVLCSIDDNDITFLFFL